MEAVPLLNGERSVQGSQLESMGRAGAEDRVTERGAAGGFMLAARVAASLQPRILQNKRKFEDVEGVGEFSGLMAVRPRWELGEDSCQETIASKTMALGEQLSNCEIEARALEESGVCGGMNLVSEESSFNKPAVQVLNDEESATSDKLHSENDDGTMDSNLSEVETLRAVSVDVLNVPSSSSKEDVKESMTDEEEGEILMECSSPGDHATSLRSIVSDKVDDSLQPISDAVENMLPLSEIEEHQDRRVDSSEFEHQDRRVDSIVDSSEFGYNANYMDILGKEKEKDEELVNSFSKSGMETLEDSYANIPSCSSSQDCSVVKNSSIGSSSVQEMYTDEAFSEGRLQFFVRTILDGPTVVLHASLSDTVESIHRQIQWRTGLPSNEQRLIYCGKQLQRDQTLADYKVTNDATLHLVGRMRSTSLPHSWQLINDLVATIQLLCKTDDARKVLQDRVLCQVKEFLKMDAKPTPSEHMQVFQLAGTTQALVVLLLSSTDSNSKCAEECIKLFTAPNDDYLPNRSHCFCAPVLLDFCKLLAKNAPEHSLYTACRGSLASLMDTIGVDHVSQYFNDAKPSTVVQEFSPFVNELSIRLSSNLCWTTKACAHKERTVNILQHVKEGQDFTAFVIPLCKAMESCKENEFKMSSNTNYREEKQKSVRKDFYQKQTVTANCFKEEIGTHKWLQTVFRKLLQEIDSCLEVVEEVRDEPGTATTDDHPFGLAPFLVVLKGLHAIANLYSESMDELLSILKEHRKALNILIRQSRWHDDHFWLLDYGNFLDFESKKRLVMAMLPEPQDDHDERQEVVVHRPQLLTESFELLAYVEPEVLQGGISVEFITEEATGPGVLREWFCLICHEIFNPQNALFLSCPNDRRRFFPNPASGVNPGHLTYFKFSGRVIALALMHKVQIDIVLAPIFFKQLAGEIVNWEDVQDADPELYFSCKKILEMDAEILDSDALGLTFMTEVEELGSRKTVELCPGGRDLVVNSSNRHEYVNLLIQRRFVISVTEQVKCFAQGFQDLLVNSTYQQFLRALKPEDMDQMLYGSDRGICVEDWNAHTEYHDYDEGDDTIKWFWQVVGDMTMERRRKLLFFSTSLVHLPSEGFSGLSSKFHIHRAYTDLNWLPTAHTCFYQLVLPPYSSFEVMNDRLCAITEEHIAEGFGFP